MRRLATQALESQGAGRSQKEQLAHWQQNRRTLVRVCSCTAALVHVQRFEGQAPCHGKPCRVQAYSTISALFVSRPPHAACKPGPTSQVCRHARDCHDICMTCFMIYMHGTGAQSVNMSRACLHMPAASRRHGALACASARCPSASADGRGHDARGHCRCRGSRPQSEGIGATAGSCCHTSMGSSNKDPRSAALMALPS